MFNPYQHQLDQAALQASPPSVENVQDVRDWSAADFADERQRAFKAVIEAMGVDHVVYWPTLAHQLQSVSAAVLLSQLYYWAERVHLKMGDSDGWYFKSIHELQKETGMGRREIESARAVLIRFGLLEWFIGGMPRTTYYRVNMTALAKLVIGDPALLTTQQLSQSQPANRQASDFLQRETLAKALGRPVLLNRTVAHLTGGINCGIYLSSLIYEIKTQVKANDDEPAWILNAKLDDITKSLALTKRQTEYARHHLRRLGVIREFRKGIPAATISAINWGKLSTRLIEYANSPKIFSQIIAKNDINFSEFTSEQAGDALSACSKDSFQHVSRNPSNKTLQKRHTGLDKNATLDPTKTPHRTLQKRPTQTAFLSDPHVLDYTYIKPPPPTITDTLTNRARSQNEMVEEADLSNQSQQPRQRPNLPPEIPLVVSKLIPAHLHDQMKVLVQAVLLHHQKNRLSTLAKTPVIQDAITAQAVLDEVGGRVRNTALPPLLNVLAYTRKLVEKALIGTLELEAAYAETHIRNRSVLEQQARLKQQSDCLPQSLELDEKALAEKRERYRKLLKFKTRH